MLYKGGVFKPPRDSFETEDDAVPRYRRPPSGSKVFRSHNKDEPAVKSAQGHYIKRAGSSSKGYTNSELGTESYKYGNQSVDDIAQQMPLDEV